MSSSTSSVLNEDAQLETVRWLIERVDNLRSSASNRAAIVISADAIFLTGAMFLLDKFLSRSGQTGLPIRLIFLGTVLVAITLFVFSILNATNAIAFVWKTSKEALGGQKLPDFLFFRPRDTEKALPGYEDLRAEFSRSTKEQMIGYALGELYIASRVHTKRYRNLRHSIRFLIIAVFALLASIVIFFSQTAFA
ncbi:MAG TPA: hypothetical protein VGO56_21980 [Pyrinomonadaceae bacterium]|jgi:hypothetical protein|nr:hypothetical protein [Pyrinomonadaceae bacterium]